MNILKPLFFMCLFICNDVFANVCTFISDYGQNQLIKKSHNLSDSSPFFTKNQLSSYKAGQYDIDTHDYFINSYGNKLNLTGNSWKTVKLNNYFIVNENSYLEFQFLSKGDEAEINGVGLMLYGSSGFHSDRFFQIYGTQTAHNQDFHNYPGSNWVTYRIPLWQYFQNTNNKVIDKLIFAGDDDQQQVNQIVYYKNVRLIESYNDYALPTSFEHAPVIIQPTANKKIFHHIYPQIITGPDNNQYPVSGGSIVKKVYAPPNSNIQEIIFVKENYYGGLCWDQGINFDSNTLSTNSMNSLQSIVNVTGANMNSFRNQQPVVLTQNNFMYFDPDVEINGQTKSRFINKSRIFSNQSLAYFYEERDAGQNTEIKNGFASMDVDCSLSGTGKNTKNVCFDLTNLTTYASASNRYLSDSQLTIVKEDLTDPDANEDNFQIVTDLDNRWSEDDLKKQTTEILVNTKYFDSYIKSFNPNNSLEDLIGFKPYTIINSLKPYTASFYPLKKYVIFSPPGKDYKGSPVTFSRDMGVLAHEYGHAISTSWFGLQLIEGSIQGCAINEGFSDIMGYGTKFHITNNYNPSLAVDAFDNNDKPYGIRNAADPSLTGGPSVFTGSITQTRICNPPPPDPPCNPVTTVCDNKYIEVAGHKQATIVTHLYHLMVSGGFNANLDFRPDPFGILPDETFSHKAAERLFFNAMSMGHGSSNSQGNDFTYCDLRNNMLQATGNDTDKVKINQAWKQVYENLDTNCPLPTGVSLLKPMIEIVNIDNNSIISSSGSLDFGNVNAGFIKTIDVQINNIGDYKLRIINPSIDSTKFSQFGLSSQPMTINVGESTTIQVKFSASSNITGLNQAALTFETNHPDYEVYNINLSGNSVSNTGPDSYEDNDTYSSASIIDFNGNFQLHNFLDDSNDWLKAGGISVPYTSGCPIFSCSLEFKNINTSSLCLQIYTNSSNNTSKTYELSKSIDPIGNKICNLQNGSYFFTKLEHVIWPSRAPVCNNYKSPDNRRIKITEESGVLSETKNYKVKMTCIEQN